MAGIEPASKKFDQRHTTSIVGLVFSHRRRPARRGPTAYQPMHLWPALSASCVPHPDLFDARSPALGKSEEADVTDSSRSVVYAICAALGGQGIGRLRSVVGTFRGAPDYRG